MDMQDMNVRALLELTAGRCVPETLGTLYADM